MQGQIAEVRRLKAELKRVSKERDIRKKAAAFPKGISCGAYLEPAPENRTEG